MYIYNTLPIELLESILSNYTEYDQKEVIFLIIKKNGEGQYEIGQAKEHAVVDVLDVPFIVGIKYVRNGRNN